MSARSRLMSARADTQVRPYRSREAIMKAIAVKPGTPNTIHLTELSAPAVDEIPNGRGVLVRVLRVGVDGTDKPEFRN